MPLSDAEIGGQNPWWTNAAWESDDPHLRRLDGQPRRLPADLVERIELSEAAIHTLRGPRQVGKSTDLKLLVRRALGEGFAPRRVVYLTLDLLEDQPIAELAATVKRAKALAGAEGGALLLFDEVTMIGRWQTALKALWDDGTIDRDTVICTGSSAVDLRDGTAERLPGRRGPGLDHAVFPQSFAAFARAIDPSVPVSPNTSLADMAAAPGHAELHEMLAFKPALDRALELYLRFGGLPAAVSEAAGGASAPSEPTKNVIYDSLLKEIHGRRAGRVATHALLERTTRSLGSKTSWARLAREMGATMKPTPAGETARRYMEFMAAAYFVLIVYFWRQSSDSAELSRDKKLYFGDLLLHTVAHDVAPGLPVDVPALVENAIALALYHRHEPAEARLEGFGDPGDLHVWHTSGSGEIDFVCGPRSDAAIVEVKYQHRPDLRTAASIPRAFPGRPVIVATKDQLEHRGAYALIPSSILLWALG